MSSLQPKKCQNQHSCNIKLLGKREANFCANLFSSTTLNIHALGCLVNPEHKRRWLKSVTSTNLKGVNNNLIKVTANLKGSAQFFLITEPAPLHFSVLIGGRSQSSSRCIVLMNECYPLLAWTSSNGTHFNFNPSTRLQVANKRIFLFCTICRIRCFPQSSSSSDLG